MNPRELIILLLGFVMVAVLLRGLFVAIQIRKGQIRLTIDKNIPQDFDLEEWELAELPAGGARVVNRADTSQQFEPDDSFVTLYGPAAKNGDSIPILMDVVELEDPGLTPEALVSERQEQGAILPAAFHQDTAISAITPNSIEESKSTRNNIVRETDKLQRNIAVNHGFEEVTDYESAWEGSGEANPEATHYENANDLNPASSTQKTSLTPEIPDYPENEWYEDEELYEVSDRLHERSRSDSIEIDDALSTTERSENLNTAGFICDKPTEFSELDVRDSSLEKSSLDSSESDDLSDSGIFENFSMTAGERIGFDEPQTRSDMDEGASEDRQASINKNTSIRGGLNRLLSVFKSKPKEGLLEKNQNLDGKEISLQSDLIEELEDFIDQNENDLSLRGKGVDFDPTREQLEDDYEQVPDLDNVTSIERAVSSSDHSDSSEVGKQENSLKVLSKSRNPDPLEVLVISVMSSSGSVFEGRYLVQMIERAGFRYGEMGIFHLYDGIGEDANLICSAANALNPGTFDLNHLSEFSTIGVSFFLALPTSINNLRAFEKMLDAAQQISSVLDGELKDDQRNILTSQTIEHYRQRIRDFELDQLKVAGGRG